MKKGFTLMELLGIIVVLGIITLITYGVISNNVESSRKKAYEISVQNVIEATKQYVIKNDIENDFPEGGIDIANKEIDLKHDDFISGLIKRNEKGIVEVVNLTNGKYCANGTKQNLKIEKGTCEASDETEAEVKINI